MYPIELSYTSYSISFPSIPYEAETKSRLMDSVAKVNGGAPLLSNNGESQSHSHMDPKLHEAAAKGNVEPFKVMGKDVIRSLVTVTNNTILHINIIADQGHRDKTNTTVSSTQFVEEILDLCPSLLLKVNAKGDTPLHVAVKCNRVDIVRVLIERAKSQHDANDDLESGTVGAARCREMIGMLNNEKNTALHEAVCLGRLDIVEILLKEEPEFPYSANNVGETPLYMSAAKNSFESSFEMVAEIFKHCPSPADQGPGGKTALHAAVINWADDGVIEQIIDKKKSLITDQDQYGWTPLHYAAYEGQPPTIKVLLECDSSAAKIADKERKMTALHLAAAQGHKRIVDLLISYCPECCELVDARGWNVLHFAVPSFDAEQLKDLLKNVYVRNLINEKDVNGNTPLHVMAAFCGYSTHGIVETEGNYAAVNKQNISVRHIIGYGDPELKEEIKKLSKGVDKGQYPKGFIKIRGKKWSIAWKEIANDALGMKAAAEYQLVVSALIATVTFAAAFTLPGGYKGEEDPNKGTAILTRKAAFQAFVITNAMAMVLSLVSVFIHFIMSLKMFKELVVLFLFALSFTLIAMIAMVIAFITGTYATLSPSLGLAIPTCFIGLSFFLLIVYLVYKAIGYWRESLWMEYVE